MSFLNQLLTAQNIPQETIVLLLMLPLAATLIAFSRQVIGIKGFGIYTPLLIAFAFLATGLKYGLVFFITIVAVGTIMRLAVKKLRLLYLPRMAIVLTTVAVAIVLVFLIGSYFNSQELLAVPVLAILIMIPLVEKFVAAQIERGARSAVSITIETFLLALVSYWLINWPWLQELVFNYAIWFILASVAINFFLGRWSGLRLTEYYRFREVIKHIEPEKKK